MKSLFPVRYLACLVPLALLALAPVGAADKTKTAFVPERNPVNLTDKGVPVDFSGEEDNEKNVKWKAALGGTSYGGPVVAGGKVFVGTNNDQPRDRAVKGDRGVVMCFDAKTGRFLWQAVHDKLEGGEATDYPKQGVASTPTVDGDRVYYVSNRCELVCADVNGDPKNPGKAKFHWKYDMIKELKVFPCQLAASSPLIVGDLVFTVTGNGMDVTADPWELPSPDAPSFIAVNKRTGELVWKDNSPGKDLMEGQWSSPVCAEVNGKAQVIFPGGDGWLYAFDAAEPGKPIWKFNCNPKNAVFNPKNWRVTDRGYAVATPVVCDNKLYVGLGRDPQHGGGVSRLLCVDITKKGDVSPKDDAFDPAAPANKGSALVWHLGGKIVPRPQRDRDIRFGLTLSTCCVVDGLVYVGELDGYVHCLDAKTGHKYWTHDTRSEMWASAYYADGKVSIGNHDGDLYVFEHGKVLKEPKVIPFGRGLKTPVRFADGLLYVMTDTTLFAFEKK